MNVNQKIQSFLSKHKTQKRWRYLTALLSFMIVISVVSSLIMPAVSMTIGISSGGSIAANELMLLAAEGEDRDISSALNITNADEWTISVSHSGDYYYNKSYENGVCVNNKPSENIAPIDADSVSLNFYVEYKFNEDGKNLTYEKGTPNLILALGSDPSICNAEYTGDVTADVSYIKYLNENDIETTKDQYAGTYVVSGGMVYIYLYEEYIDYVTSGEGTLIGTLNFDLEVNRSADEDGDVELNINGEKFPVEFENKTPKITNKSGSLDSDNGKITWTVTIDSHKLDLSDYTLTDDMLTNASNIKINGTDINSDSNANQDGNTITFSGAYDSEQITITYTTDITAAQLKAGKAENTATFGDDSKKGTAWLNSFYVNKSGTADYNSGKINWTITVDSQNGVSLEDYTVSDDRFSSAANIKINGELYTGTVSNNSITLNDLGDNAKRVTITYETELSEAEKAETQDYYNEAIVRYPNEPESEAGSDDETVTYKAEKDLINFSKIYQDYKPDTHEVIWQVTVTPDAGKSLNGYTLTDSQFPTDLSDIDFSATNNGGYVQNNNGDWVSISNYVSLSGNTLTFGDILGNVTFTYKTKVDMPQVTGTAQTTAVSNGMTDSNSHTATVVTTIAVRNELQKNLNTQDGTEANNGKIEKTLSWTANITFDGSFADQVYTDTLSSDGTGATHTLNADSIVVKAKKKSSDAQTTLTKDVDYTVSQSGNGFTITFDSSLDAEYNYVEITYETTATMAKPSSDATYPITYKFSNSGSFNGNTDNDNVYTFTRTNPNTSETGNLTINKTWGRNDNGGIDNITVKIKYGTSQNQSATAWQGYVSFDSDGNAYYPGDDGYNPDSEEVVISSNDQWNKVLSGLLRMKAEADATTGQQKDPTYYRYIIEEVKIGSYDVSKSKIYSADNGIYQAFADTDFQFDYNGQYVTKGVNNNYYKNVTITPQKSWVNGSNGISEVTVQLMYQYEGIGWTFADTNTYPPITISGSKIDENGNWTTTESWQNLPTAIEAEDGTLKTITYKVVETKCGDTVIEYTDDAYLTKSKFAYSGNDVTGYYDVQNSNSVSYTATNTDNTVAVTNTFIKSENLTINAEKAWNDENNAERPVSVIVQLQQKASDSQEWLPYPNEGDSKATLNIGNGWKCSWGELPNQSIDEDNVVTTYTYKVVEVGYIYNGESIMLPNGASSFAAADNGTYSIGYSTQELNQDGTVTITNTFNKVQELSIIPQKKWEGDADHLTGRPNNVTFELQRKLSNSNTWETVEDSNGDPIQVTLSDVNADEWDSNLWNGTEIQNLPQKEITPNEDGTYTELYYTYRLVETAHDGVAIKSNESTFKTDDGKYTITLSETNSSGVLTVKNTFAESTGITKFLLDKDGNQVSSVDMEDLIAENSPYRKTINGEEYYVFNWMIEFDVKASQNINDVQKPVIDMLPEGFTLVEDTSKSGNPENLGQGGYISGVTGAEVYQGVHKALGDYYVNPLFIWQTYYACWMVNRSEESGLWDNWSNDCYYYYKENYQSESLGGWSYKDGGNAELIGKNILIFNKPYNSASLSPFIGYSTKIKCEDLEKLLENGSYTITNNARLYEPDKDSKTITKTDKNGSASLTIVNKAPSDLITKSYSETIIPGYIMYSLDINPEAKNLSNGDTIDIEDLFKTSDYTDNDLVAGIKKYYGENLVDVLMDSITLYRVDANGNKKKLTSSEYTLQFESSQAGVTNSDGENGAALLQLTIPDEEHIEIVYYYKLIANEKTPSVINGCDSNVRVNGRIDTMKPGYVPPIGDKISFENKAVLKADSAYGEDDHSETDYEIKSSSGTISTTSRPKITKVNTGDYTINDLKSTFLLAKYEDGKWFYSMNVGDKGVIEWSTTGAEGYAVPENEAAEIVVGDTPVEVALSENTLYKLVEVSVPNGYEGSNLGLSDAQFKEMLLSYLNDNTKVTYNGTDYSVFLNKYVHTHYFSYNSTLTSSDYPDYVSSSDIIQIKSGDDIEIPNNELIDIGVSKKWIDSNGDEVEIPDAEVTVRLYWSYKKASTGMPDAVYEANAADLGIMDKTFVSEKTLSMSDLDSNTPVWRDLPNGKNDKSIYYYIKEIAYTIGGKTYTLVEDENDPNNGKYTSEDDSGGYLPTYVGNAANSDAEITISNSEQLILRKDWKDSAGGSLGARYIPTDKIYVSIYGVNSDNIKTEQPIFANVELTRADGWKANITDLLKQNNVDLSQYKSFVAEETGGKYLDDFVVSCVFNLNADTGEITVTNRSTQPTEASVTVNKVWSDGAELHKSDAITVSLYQTTAEITDITDLTADKLIEAGASIMTAVDATDEQIYKDVELNAAGEWSYTWTGLPLDDGTADTDPTVSYYYYVVEDLSGLGEEMSGKYSTSYQVTSSGAKTEITVTNTRQAIVVQKLWYNEDGTPAVLYDANGNLVDENGNPTDAYDALSATLNVYKIVPQIPVSTKIHALGDSITDGSLCGGGVSYATSNDSSLLAKDLNSPTYGSFQNVTVVEDGTNSEQIDDLLNRQINSDDTVITLLIGTNDIIQNNDLDNIIVRLENLIETMYTQTEKSTPMFVASIPDFNYTMDYCLPRDQGWFSQHSSAISGMSNKEIETYINGLVETYNKQIPDLVEKLQNEGYNIYFVDVNSVVDKNTDLYDGCHPNVSGSTKIAHAFAAATYSYYSLHEPVGEVTLNKDNNWTAALDIKTADAGDASRSYFVEEDEEDSTGWTVKYSVGSTTSEKASDVTVKLGSSTPIVVKNTRYSPKTSLTVEKTWKGDSTGAPERDGIKFTLLRSTDPESGIWEEYKVAMPAYTVSKSADGNDVWTYVYGVDEEGSPTLPAEDINGNTYYYKVEEAPLSGYTTTYLSNESNGFLSKTGENAGTMHITNTRAISLTVKKLWSDIDKNKHLSDTVKIKIYRSTAKNTDSVDLILDLPSSASVGVGKNITVTANKDIELVSIGDETIASVEIDGKNITITGLKDGNTTITVTDGTDEKTISVTVSSLEIFLNGESTFTIEAGQTGTLSAQVNGSAVDATFSVTDGSNYVSINGSTLNAVNIGKATVTATANGVTASVEVEVVRPSSDSLQDNEPVTITAGKTDSLIPSTRYGTFEWSTSDEKVVTVDQSGTITGIAEGTATITATCKEDGATATWSVTVNSLQTGTLKEGYTYTYDAENGIVTITISGAKSDGNYTFREEIRKDSVLKDLVPIKYEVNITNTTLYFKGPGADFRQFSNGVIDANDNTTSFADWSSDIVLGDYSDGNYHGPYTLTIHVKQSGQSTTTTTTTTTSAGGSTASSSSTTTTTTTTTTSGGATTQPSSGIELSGGATKEITLDSSKFLQSITFEMSSSTSTDAKLYFYLNSWGAYFGQIVYDGSTFTNNGWNSYGIDSCDINGNTVTVTFSADKSDSSLIVKNDGSSTLSIKSYTITYADASIQAQSYSLRSEAEQFTSSMYLTLPTMLIEENELTPYGTLEISATGAKWTVDGVTTELTSSDWSAVISDLPVYDENGNAYYYWAAEEAVNGYQTAYLFTDDNGDTEYCIDSSNLGDGIITIKNTPTESSSVIMPSTGGEGTTWYYITGMAIMLSSTAAYILIKRRRERAVK